MLAASVCWLIPGTAGETIGGVVTCLLIIAAGFDYLRLPRQRDVTIERRVPETIGLGDDGSIEYTVASRAATEFAFQLFDAYPASVNGVINSDLVRLGSGDERSRTVPIVAARRGRVVFGPVAIRATTTLDLVARIIRVAPGGDMVVVPSLSNVRRLRALAIQNRLSEAGVRALKQRGEGTEFGGLRDYTPGDDPRLLDWKATARHQKLITREQTIERAQTVLAMIDCGRAMTQLAGRYSRFEHVLSAALVFADVAATSGDRVGVIAFDDEIRSFAPPQKGMVALRSLRSALSALDATMTEPDYASAFRLLATKQRRRALVVFFTDVLDVRTAKSFIAHASRGARQHMLLVVAIRNDELIAAARPSASGSLALYRSAAAEELIREREEALARMRQAGVVVLDVPVGAMAPAVVNRYLEIKSRGLL